MSARREHAVEHDVERQSQIARDLLAMIDIDGDDVLAQDMIEGETGLMEAIDRAIVELRECDVTAEGCKAEVATLNARKDRAERRKAHIRAAIEQAMVTAGIDTIRRPTKTLTIAHRKGAAVITCEADIPVEFWEPQPPKINKKALNDAVAERTVPGAHQGNGSVSLTIRSK